MIELPPALLEATLDLAAAMRAERDLQQARDQTLAQIRDIQKRKTRVDFLLARSKHKVEIKEISELEAQVKAMEEARHRAAFLQKRVEPSYLNALDDYLRETSREYKQGLAAQRMRADAEISLANFADKVHRLVLAVGVTRNQMGVGYNRQEGRHSDQARQELNIARSAAREVEEVVDFYNGLADLHDQQTRDTPYADLVFPRIEGFPYVTWLDSQWDLPIGQAQANFTELIERLERLEHEDLAKLREVFLQTETDHNRQSESLIRNLARSLIDFASQNWVTPEMQEERIARLEARFANARGPAPVSVGPALVLSPEPAMAAAEAPSPSPPPASETVAEPTSAGGSAEPRKDVGEGP